MKKKLNRNSRSVYITKYIMVFDLLKYLFYFYYYKINADLIFSENITFIILLLISIKSL